MKKKENINTSEKKRLKIKIVIKSFLYMCLSLSILFSKLSSELISKMFEMCYRSYYRCSHKNDQGCQAMKQVQRIQDNPPLYRTTYYSHHTCKSPMNPEIIVEPFSPSASSILLSFDNNLQSKQENPFSSSILASTKHEPQEVIHNEHSAQNKLSTFENLLFYDYDIPFDYSRNATLLSSTEAVQFENVYEQYGF